MPSIFTPLEKEGLTSLTVRYDWKTDDICLSAAKEWQPELDFSRYNQDFFIDSVLTKKSLHLNHYQVIELFKQYNLTDHLEQVLALIRKGKHHGIECYFNAKKNIRFICNQHSIRKGLNSKKFAQFAGGIRRHPLEDKEIDVIIDGLNLGRAMSLKNIVAQVPFGGSKITVHMDALDLNDDYSLGFLAFAMDRCRTMTSPDMHLPVEMSDIISQKYSKQFIGGAKMPLGTTGKPTAYGLYIALKEAVKFKTGSRSLAGKSIVLQGLGAVGWFMAEHLLTEDVQLSVADLNGDTVAKLINKYPNKGIKDVSSQDVLTLEADIFCPCAMGGFIDRQVIANFNYHYVFGAANNQLKASSDEEEIALAKLLEQRGILFQTDFVQNSAGVICGSASYIYGDDGDYNLLLKRIDEVLPARTWENLTKAQELGITATEYVYRYCQEALYG